MPLGVIMRLTRVLDCELSEQILAIDKRIVVKNCSADGASVRGLRKEIARLLTKKDCSGRVSSGVPL